MVKKSEKVEEKKKSKSSKSKSSKLKSSKDETVKKKAAPTKQEKKKRHVHSDKAAPRAPIHPATGTRFSPGSARQCAFDIIYKSAKDKKNASQIRDILKGARKSEGHKYNLDTGYLHFVIATHPEMLEIYTDGEVRIISHPKPDKMAAKKIEKEAEQKRARAQEAREKRKAKAKGGDKETKSAKSTKSTKSTKSNKDKSAKKKRKAPEIKE